MAEEADDPSVWVSEQKNNFIVAEDRHFGDLFEKPYFSLVERLLEKITKQETPLFTLRYFKSSHFEIAIFLRPINCYI